MFNCYQEARKALKRRNVVYFCIADGRARKRRSAANGSRFTDAVLLYIDSAFQHWYHATLGRLIDQSQATEELLASRVSRDSTHFLG